MRKSNINTIFHIPCWPVGLWKHVVLRGVFWLRNHLPHMPAHSRQSKRQNIVDRTHTWQQCSVTTSKDILTTKYSFNLRQNSPLSIDNNTGYSRWIRVSVAHALIVPQSLKLAHFWSDIRWFPPLLLSYIPLHGLKRDGEKVLNATVPTASPGNHSQVESPARGYRAKIAPT